MAMSTRPRLLAVLVAASLLVAACGAAGPTDGSDEPPPAGADPGNLAGRTFLSTAITGRDLVPGSQVRLSFEVGRIGAQAGCNSMGGSVAIVDGRLVLADLATTEMACDPALMDQDTWLADFLDGAAITLAGDTLTLAKDAVTLTLLDGEVADPDRPLVGTRWIVDGLVSGEAVSSVPAGVVASLVFTADGRVAVEAGCNSGGAPVTVEAATLTFGPLVLTEMACDGPATELERVVTSVLAGTVAHKIDADVLTLDHGGTGLILRATP
jgi:heat shock protein HslJ